MSNQLTQKTVLDNGLSVVTGYISDQATSEIYISIHVNSGSADDMTNGEAHFLEHMLFNGIETPRGSIDFKTLKQEREQNGIMFNAHTNRTETVYKATVPTALGDEGVERALYELSRMVASPSLLEDRIAHEKKVIHNEWGSYQSDLSRFLLDQLFLSAYADNPEFSHRILGEREDIAQISREGLVNFMASHYTAPNMTVAFSGPVDHRRVVSWAEDMSTDLPDVERPDLPVETTPTPFYETINFSILPHAFFTICLSWEGSDDYESDIAIAMAQSVLSKRLNDVVREEKGDTYGLSVSSNKFRQTGVMQIHTDTDSSNVAHILKEIAREFSSLAYGDIEQEIETMKGFWRNGNASTRRNAEYMMANLIDDSGRFGALYNPDISLEQIDNVTACAVQSYILKAVSNPIGLVGLAPEGSFPPEAKFRDIMRLQESSQKLRLRRDFTA